MEKVKIRKAKKEDFLQILELAKQLWNTEKVFSENIRSDYYENEYSNKKLEKEIINRNNIFLVATINEKIVGMISGNIMENNGAYKQQIAYIDKIVVDKENRKNGIGKQLIDEYSKRVKKRGCAYLKLNAFENNIPAINFYIKNMGFEEYSIMYMKKIK